MLLDRGWDAPFLFPHTCPKSEFHQTSSLSAGEFWCSPSCTHSPQHTRQDQLLCAGAGESLMLLFHRISRVQGILCPQSRNHLSLFFGCPSWGIFILLHCISFNCGSGCYGTLHIYILIEFPRIPALNLEQFLFVYCSVCACVCGCRRSCATVHVESENNLWESVLSCFLVGSMAKTRVIKHACKCHYLLRHLSHLSLKYFLVILLITVALRRVFASFKSSFFFFFLG